jgi:hypothetical protein
MQELSDATANAGEEESSAFFQRWKFAPAQLGLCNLLTKSAIAFPASTPRSFGVEVSLSLVTLCVAKLTAAFPASTPKSSLSVIWGKCFLEYCLSGMLFLPPAGDIQMAIAT